MLNVVPMILQERHLPLRCVLHVGCGPASPHRLHSIFRQPKEWQEIRLDIDNQVEPDIVCSAVDMRSSISSGSVDAIWTSHTIEHLFDHDAVSALAEFHRVLNATGFLLLRCPDLTSVAEQFLSKGLEVAAYESPAGPITPLDMFFGHRPSIESGNSFMSHRTGFTDERLGRMLLNVGFSEVRTKRADGYDLWAVAFESRADVAGVLDSLRLSGLSFEV